MKLRVVSLQPLNEGLNREARLSKPGNTKITNSKTRQNGNVLRSFDDDDVLS